MAESRYEKYIVRKPAVLGKDGRIEYPDKFNFEGMADTGPLVWRSPEQAKETDSFVEHGIISGDIVVGGGVEIGPGGFVEKPHKHAEHGEIFLFIGTDPSDPTDLGAEAEFCLGEGDEMERIVLNTSASVYVPPGVAHFPLTWRNVRRPCVFVVIPSPGGSTPVASLEADTV